MPRSWILPAAILLAISTELYAACTSGALFNTTNFIESFAAAPSGNAIAVLLRVTPLTEAGRHVVEYRGDANAAPRVLHETTFPVSPLAADDDAVYLAERDSDGRTTRILRLKPHAARATVLATLDTAGDVRLHADGESVYVIAGGQLWRVPAAGGEKELVAAWTGFINPNVDSDEDALYHALQDFAGVSSIYRYDKRSREVRHLLTHSALRSLAVDGPWLYFATPNEIRRVPIDGDAASELIATLQPLVHGTDSFFDVIDVAGTRIVARQEKAVPRGCAADILVQYAGGTASLLSHRAGAFRLAEDGSVLHAPRPCFLVAPQPPFVVERFCLATGRNRAARH